MLTSSDKEIIIERLVVQSQGCVSDKHGQHKSTDRHHDVDRRRKVGIVLCPCMLYEDERIMRDLPSYTIHQGTAHW